MNKSLTYAQLNSPLQQEWKRDRLLRQRVPFDESWRGCVGLAVMWANVDDCECVDERILYSNDNLTWLCLRDIPANHFPSSRTMNGRDVNFVTAAKARLRYGMPVLDFAEPSREMWDFRKLPHGTIRIQKSSGVDCRLAAGYTLDADERPREFAALNKLSRAMTEFAFFARDEDGRSIRLPWARKRPRGRAISTIPPQEWFPIPYLGFRATDLRQLENTRLWLSCSSHGIKLKTRPHRVFLPARVCEQLVHFVPPVELMWDTDAWEPYIDPKLEVAIFPPIRLRKWRSLRMNVAHICLDARIGDPLFSPSRSPFPHTNRAGQNRNRNRMLATRIPEASVCSVPSVLHGTSPVALSA